jgi:hypothetical protein
VDGLGMNLVLGNGLADELTGFSINLRLGLV